MSNHADDVERAYVQSRLYHAEYQLDRAAEQMQVDLDRELARLRETWSTSAELVAADEAQRRADHQAWLRTLEDEEPLPPHVAGERAGVFPGRHAPASPGPAPQQPNPAAGLTADDIKNMSMKDFAARRSELGIRSAESMSRLSG